MGVLSARIVGVLLIISAASAGPAASIGQNRRAQELSNLLAKARETVAEAGAAPDHQDGHRNTNGNIEAEDPDHSSELVSDAQSFFPSFANLFEPRLPTSYRQTGIGNQEGAFSQRPASYRSLLNFPSVFGNYRNHDGFAKQETAASASPSGGMLGSGNFGIIRGGTFNSQNEEDDYGDVFSFFNNGHGRPSLGTGYIANPRPNYNVDQFANFRDFADINTPSNSAYSQFVVVYANKNATIHEVSEEAKRVAKPKNIFETLERLETKSPPKVSKSKAKLALAKQKMLSKKEQWKRMNSKLNQKHDPEEPLLALS